MRRRFCGAEVGGFNRLVCHLSAPVKISDLVSYALSHHTPHLCRPPPCRLLKLVMFISKRRDDAILE